MAIAETASTPDPESPAQRSQRSSRGIAAWLAGVSLLALLPMLAFSAFTVYRAIAEEQTQATAALQRRATVAAAAIGHELDGIFAELNAMSQADSVRAAA